MFAHIDRMASQKSIPVVVLAVLLTTEALDCKWVSIVAPVMLCTPRPILANQADWARVGPVVILAPWPILALHRIGASVAHTTVGRWPAGLRLLASPASHRVDSRVIAHLANILYVPVSLTGLSQENLTITIKFCLLSPFPCFLVRPKSSKDEIRLVLLCRATTLLKQALFHFYTYSVCFFTLKVFFM